MIRQIVLLFDRLMNRLRRDYRNYIFYLKTGYRAKLVGDVILINSNLVVGDNVTVYPGAMFFGDGLIEIGDNVDIGNGTVIYASENARVKIGSGTMIAAQGYIIDTDHGIEIDQPIREQKCRSEKIVIGRDCWLAAGVKVLKGSRIHDGAVVGAQSVVKGELPCNSISVGVPAKVIKYRG